MARKGDNRIIRICLFSCQNCSKRRKKMEQNISRGMGSGTQGCGSDNYFRNSWSYRTRILIMNTDPEVLKMPSILLRSTRNTSKMIFQHFMIFSSEENHYRYLITQLNFFLWYKKRSRRPWRLGWRKGTNQKSSTSNMEDPLNCLGIFATLNDFHLLLYSGAFRILMYTKIFVHFMQGCGSVLIFYGSGSGSRAWCWRPIRIQGFNDQKLKKNTAEIFFFFYDQKLQLTYP